MVIDGKALAEEIISNLKEKRKNYKKIRIASFLIGKDEEKLSFLKIKKTFAEKLDIDFRIYEVEENITRKKLRKYIRQIVKSKAVKGAIIQLPLPSKFSAQYFLNAIPEKKDIDCLSSRLLGKFYSGSYAIRPTVVEALDFLKNKFNLDFQGKTALVVGYGRLVGKPIAHYLANEKVTVIIAQDQTNLEEYLKKTDIIITGVGKEKLIQDCQEGAILIDFGYTKKEGKIYGDLDFEKLKNKASLITPTPNGTGPIVVAKLFENLFKLMKVYEK